MPTHNYPLRKLDPCGLSRANKEGLTLGKHAFFCSEFSERFVELTFACPL
jgi:hypothetical protein